MVVAEDSTIAYSFSQAYWAESLSKEKYPLSPMLCWIQQMLLHGLALLAGGGFYNWVLRGLVKATSQNPKPMTRILLSEDYSSNF